MDHQLGDMGASVPTLDTGITLLHADDRTTGHHQLTLAQLQQDRGPVIWIDARDTASTYTFHELTTNPRLLAQFSIARAWTAYQHHTLIRQAVEQTTPRTKLVVVPHVCALYAVDDLPEEEGEWLLRASLQVLSALAAARSLPVLLTTNGARSIPCPDLIDHELTWKRTSEGQTFTGGAGDTMVYRGDWWWQTTVPYWVDLVGTDNGNRWEQPEPIPTSDPLLVDY